MRRIGLFIVSHRILTFTALCVLAGFLGWRASLLQENLSFETLYLAGDPNIEFSDQFTKQFENVDDMIAVAITGGDIFAPDLLRAVGGITERLEKLFYIEKVTSITNVRFVEGREDSLDVIQLVDRIPETPEQVEALRRKAMGYELFKGRLISRDGKYMAIIAQASNMVRQPANRLVAQLMEQIATETEKGKREEAARQLIAAKEQAIEVLTIPKPRSTELFARLAGSNPAGREEALKELAKLGPAAVRKLTVVDRRKLVGEVEAIVQSGLPAGYKHYVTGTSVMERDYAKIIHKDRMIFHTLTFLALIGTFYLSFRSLRDTLIAFVALGIAATCALGVVQIVGGVIDIVNSVVLVMILVVGASFIVHMTSGFYEAWRAEDGDRAGPNAAVEMASSKGFPCFLASFTTACGFLSLYSARINTIARFGINTGVAILVTYLVSLVAVTLLFSFVKKGPPQAARRGDSAMSMRAIRWITNVVVDHHVLVAAGCILILGCFAVGLIFLQVESHAVAELSPKSPTKINMQAMENLAGFLGFEVSVKAAGAGSTVDPEVLRKVDKLAAFLRARPETIETWSVADYVKVMNRAAQGGGQEHFAVPASVEAVEQFLLMYAMSPQGTKEINGLVSPDRKWLRLVSRVHDVGAKPYLKLRDDVEALGRKLFPGGDFEVRVTSESFLLHSAMDRIVTDLFSSTLTAFGSVAIIMAIALRSLRLGLVAIPPNLIPVLATLGFMGFMGIPLRVGTLVVFSLGLGMVDNTIHILHEYRHARPSCKTYREMAAHIHKETGMPLMLATFLLMAGFLVTVPSSFYSIRDMGILNSFTVGVTLFTDFFVTVWLLRFVQRWPKEAAKE